LQSSFQDGGDLLCCELLFQTEQRYSAAAYRCSILNSSSHTKEIDIVLQAAMQIVKSCVSFTPNCLVPVLSGPEPPALRRNLATLQHTSKSLEGNHIFRKSMQSTTAPTRLKSRNSLRSRAPTLCGDQEWEATILDQKLSYQSNF
jgi:hypothetical protein